MAHRICQTCRGLIPFVKVEEVIPPALVECGLEHQYLGYQRIMTDRFLDCQNKVRPEHFAPVSPEDFDFAMSDSFRAASYGYCGVKDPAEAIKREPEQKEVVIKHIHYHEGERKPERKSTYKGLKIERT